MRKRVHGRTFSRKTGPRKALLKAGARALLERERIETTEAKAKEVSGFVERLLTKAKKGDVASRRYLLRYLDAKTAKRVAEELAPRYTARPGGYTRIIKLEPRASDGARMAILELV